MQRRKFIQLSGLSATLLLAGCAGVSSANERRLDLSGFTNPLDVPTLLDPTPDANGVKQYNLTLAPSSKSFFTGFTTQTWGINGSYLGPTLKMINGDSVSVNYTNNLPEVTTMHGHGMHVPPTMDGGPHSKIQVNATWSATYTLNQKASTNWYHPHLMGKTAEHVYKGLAGLIIVEDSISQSLNLPKTYGDDDIPLVLQDRFFDANKEILYAPSRRQIMRGYSSYTYLTNGVIKASKTVQAKEIRLRLLNASNSTLYRLEFNNGMSFKQIATDNSFLEAPVALSSLTLSPAERAEIVVDLSTYANKEVFLIDALHKVGFLKLNVVPATTSGAQTPLSLDTLQHLQANASTPTRNFILSASSGNFMINGASMDPNIINERVPINTIEVWNIENRMMMDHNFHIHDTHFMILERNGSSASVASNEKGYKDTVYIPPNESVKIIVKMLDFTDNVNPYMYHCHFLEHEDAGMMGQFLVV